MPSTMSLRIGDELLASAKAAGDAGGRSTAQQIGYWAKLGRELERSTSLPAREIAEVLAGARSYDDLDPKVQAVVRAEWRERIEARRAALDLVATFASEGRSWVETDAGGNIVEHAASAPEPGRGRATTSETKRTAPSRGPAKKASPKKTAGPKSVPKRKATSAKAAARKEPSPGRPGAPSAVVAAARKKGPARAR